MVTTNDTIRLYNPEEMESLVTERVVNETKQLLQENIILRSMIREQQKENRKYKNIRYNIVQFFILGFPLWCCFAMVLHWLFSV